METVKEMIRGKPIRGNLGKPMSTVFVMGKGMYRWNWAYRVYNSDKDYSQLKESELALIDFSKTGY